MVKYKLEKLVKNNFNIVEKDKKFSLYKTISSKRASGKTHDFVIYKNLSPYCIIECNIFNSTGSKPISIAESYIELNTEARKKGIIFIWLTDGIAWRKMREPILRSMKKIDFIVNLKLLSKLNFIFK